MFGSNATPEIDEGLQLHLLYEIDDLRPFASDRLNSSVENISPLQHSLNLCWQKWVNAFDGIFNSSPDRASSLDGYPWKSANTGFAPSPLILDAGFMTLGYEHMLRAVFLVRRLLRFGPGGTDNPALPAVAEAMAYAASSVSTVSPQSMGNLISLFNLDRVDRGPRSVTPLVALYSWYSELPEVSCFNLQSFLFFFFLLTDWCFFLVWRSQSLRHFTITERGFVFRGIPNVSLMRSIFGVSLNLFALAAASVSSNRTPTSQLVLRTNAGSLAMYLIQLVSLSRTSQVRPELLAAPLGFFIHVASLNADPADRMRAICPSLRLMTRPWKLNLFFSEMCQAEVALALGQNPSSFPGGNMPPSLTMAS
jgi:hypothetical protein